MSIAPPTPPHTTRWLSQADAAELLGITEKTVRRMIAAGDLPAYRLGKRLLRIKSTDLEALLQRVPAGDAR